MLLERVPSRYVIMVMIFGGAIVLNVQKHSISVSIVAMVPSYNNDSDSTSLNWNVYQRANVLSISYWGDIVACLVAGPMVERWGPRKMLFIAISAMSIFTLLSPPAAKFNYIAMLVVRFMVGFSSPPIPLWRILTSIPFWSLAVLYFGSGWGAYFVISVSPSYINKALGFNVSSSGLLSAMIYLTKSISSMIFGAVGDVLLKRGLSVNILRKGSAVISHILPGCALLLMVIPNQESAFYIGMLLLSMMFNGALTLSILANGHDLTRNFIGTVTGLLLLCLYAAGVLIPPVTALFTKEEENNIEVWRPVFYLGGGVFILSGLQFLALGSTKRQPWDELDNLETEEDTTNEKNILG